MARGKKRARLAQFYEHPDVEPATCEVIEASSKKRPRIKSTVVSAVLVAPAPPPFPPDRTCASYEPFVDHYPSSDHANGTVMDDGIPGVNVVAKQAAPRYESTTAPLKVWLQHRQEYLQETHLHDGRALLHYTECLCGAKDPTFVCRDCSFGWMLCKSCLERTHRDAPLHVVEVWQDQHWEQVSLSSLGICIQLGHPPGQVCPHQKPREVVIIHSKGIKSISVGICECGNALTVRQQFMRRGWWPATSTDPKTCATFDVLRLFHSLNLQGNLSGYDFYRSLENMTDSRKVLAIPDRLKSFMLIVRQYRNVKALRRGGRAFYANGAEGTKPGELAVVCRACPHPGINLPKDWEDAPEIISFIYRKILSQDANFRQKNRARHSTYEDVTLSPGWSYFVEDNEYMKYVRKHASEEEISTCAGFQAMMLANVKKARGLASTGVAGCMCARHELWQPSGMASLQRGERYCNMDYVLCSVLVGISAALHLILTYDIACQFFKSFWQRVEGLPKRLHPSTPHSNVIFKVPKGHLEGHTESCQGPFSLNYTEGAGATHGESPEHGWSTLNKAAPSCKEMTPSGRRETLDDVVGFHNWRKTTGLGEFLLRKLLQALKMFHQHRREFVAFHGFVQAQFPGKRDEWEAAITTWELDYTRPCPYQRESSGIKVRDVHLALAHEEEERQARDEVPSFDSSPSAFITTGIQLEKLQLELAFDISRKKNPTPLDETTFINRRTMLRQKFRRFALLRTQHVPLLNRYIHQQASYDVEVYVEPLAQDAPLYLPSSVPPEARRQLFSDVLLATEERLREAYCHEALSDLRDLLRARSTAASQKAKNSVGQADNTRSRALLTSIDSRIMKAKRRYRANWEALHELRGGGPWENTLRQLRDEDVRCLNDRVMTEQELEERRSIRRRTGLDENDIVQGIPVLSTVETGESRRTISWIWTVLVNVPMPSSEPIAYNAAVARAEEAAVSVEWARARARSRRWFEEVLLLEEEMRRAILFTKAEQRKWIQRVQAISQSPNLLPVVQEGLIGYAMQQASEERKLAEVWEAKWAAIRSRAIELREAYLRSPTSVLEAIDEEEELVRVSITVELDLAADQDGEDRFDDGDDDDSGIMLIA